MCYSSRWQKSGPAHNIVLQQIAQPPPVSRSVAPKAIQILLRHKIIQAPIPALGNKNITNSIINDLLPLSYLLNEVPTSVSLIVGPALATMQVTDLIGTIFQPSAFTLTY